MGDWLCGERSMSSLMKVRNSFFHNFVLLEKSQNGNQSSLCIHEVSLR